MNPHHQKLLEVLQEARDSLARPNNDSASSSWEDAPAALREIDGIIARIQSGDLPKRSEVNLLFLPTSPIREVSASSGWGQEFLDLAKRFDQAIARAYGAIGSEHKDVSDPTFGAADYWIQLTGGRMRWPRCLRSGALFCFLMLFRKERRRSFIFQFIFGAGRHCGRWGLQS